MGLESFASLTKAQEDLLSKKYCFGSLALLKMHSLGGPIVFKAKSAHHSDASVDASTSLSIKPASLTLTTKLSTSGPKSLSVIYPASSAFTTRVTAILSPSGTASGEISGTYSHKHLQTDVTVKYPHALKVSAVGGKKEHGVGLEAEYNAASGRFVTYNFLKYLKGKNYRVVLKHVSTDELQYKPGEIWLSYYGKTGTKTKIGAKAALNWETKNVEIEFGAAYQHSENLTLRGKLNSQGKVAAAVTKGVGKGLDVSLGTEVDIRKAAHLGVSDYNIGARVDIEL